MIPGLAPRAAAYDVVVIGSGLAGLMAAAWSARAGRSVLVVEQEKSIGGYAHGFQRGEYSFDAGIHGVSFGTIEPTLPTLLRELGVRDRVDFAPCDDPLYSAFFPDVRFDVLNGGDEFIAAHAELFPADADALRRLYREMQTLTEQLTRPRPTGSISSLAEADGRFDTLLRYRTATLSEVFEEYSLSERLRTLLGASWVNLGLPPSRLAFVSWAPLTVVRAETGEHYCRGSFQQLVDALTRAIESFGGELVVETPVRSVLLEQGRATGVRLDDGTEVRAGAVISNADARQTFEQLVGLENLPAAFARRLVKMQESLSAVVLYAAAAMPREAVDLPHVSYIHDSLDHDASYARMERGELSSLILTVPTLVDPTLAPPGEQLVNCVALVARGRDEEWTRSKERTIDLLVERIDEVMPGFRDKLTFAEAATPAALEHHSWNYRGAAYGWENSPRQVGSRRLSNVTPIDGLLLAGHWAQPGTGSLAAIYSGLRAASVVLGGPAEHLDAAAEPRGGRIVDGSIPTA
jgi:phytoene desaturase